MLYTPNNEPIYLIKGTISRTIVIPTSWCPTERLLPFFAVGLIQLNARQTCRIIPVSSEDHRIVRLKPE